MQPIRAEMPTSEVASRFEPTTCCRPRSSTDGRLLGRITVDDVIDVIREEGEHQFMGRAVCPRTRTCLHRCWRVRAAALWLGHQPRDRVSGVLGDRPIRGKPCRRWSRWRC